MYDEADDGIWDDDDDKTDDDDEVCIYKRASASIWLTHCRRAIKRLSPWSADI